MLSRFALAAALSMPAGCAWVGVPAPAMPGSGDDGMEQLLRDRVWIEQSAGAAPGSFRAFLSDGTLVMTSCVETYRLAPWRWVSDGRIVWEEDGRNINAEVAVVSDDTLALAIEIADGIIQTRTFKAAESPIVCPDLPA